MKKNINRIKKILLVSPVAPPAGGIATWTDIYATEILKRQIELDVVNTSRVNSETAKKKYHYLNEIKRFIRIIKEYSVFLKNNNYDLVHINSSCSKLGLIRDYICVKKAYKKNVMIVMHYHCDVTYMVKSNFQKKLLNIITKYSSITLTLNSQSKEYIENIKKSNVFIVPNFIDRVELINEEKHVNKNIMRIVYTGRINKEKGCDLIFEIAKVKKNIIFELIGNVLLDLDYYKPSSNVILYGEKNKKFIIDKLKNADIFLFPSHFEGFSISLLEAMANGVPIITTNVGANRDMLEEKGGIICEVDNIDDFLCAIESMENCNIRKKMSSWNVNKVLNNYLKDIVIDNILKIYNGNL